MVQETNRNPDDKLQPEENRISDSKENEMLQPEDINTQSLNANNKDTDIRKPTEDSNTRSIHESRMVQDSVIGRCKS